MEHCCSICRITGFAFSCSQEFTLPSQTREFRTTEDAIPNFKDPWEPYFITGTPNATGAARRKEPCWRTHWWWRLQKSNQWTSASYQFRGLAHYTTKVMKLRQKLACNRKRERMLTIWIFKCCNWFKCFMGSHAHGDQAHESLEQPTPPRDLPFLPQGCGVQGPSSWSTHPLAQWCPH